MEKLIAYLRAHNQCGSFPLERPSEEQLLEVEEQILMALPSDLRTFLLQVSDVVYGVLEPVTAADERARTYLPEVAANAWALGLPREYLPLSHYDQGYACIGEDGQVYFWRAGQLEQHWQDLWSWVAMVWLQGRVVNDSN